MLLKDGGGTVVGPLQAAGAYAGLSHLPFLSMRYKYPLPTVSRAIGVAHVLISGSRGHDAQHIKVSGKQLDLIAFAWYVATAYHLPVALHGESLPATLSE